MSNKPKPKPLVMWAWPSHLNARGCPIWASRIKMHHSLTQAPVKVAVIPLDDVEAIVERAAKALRELWLKEANLDAIETEKWEGLDEFTKGGYRDDARAALTAAGIPCTKRRARK